MQNFYRIGDPVAVPVSLTSAEAAVPVSFTQAQTAIPDLAFMFFNPTQFDVWLEGTPTGGQLMVAAPGNGWLIPARTVMGPFASKKPDRLSARVWDHSGNPVPPNQSFAGAAVYIVYGRGA